MSFPQSRFVDSYTYFGCCYLLGPSNILSLSEELGIDAGVGGGLGKVACPALGRLEVRRVQHKLAGGSLEGGGHKSGLIS